MTRSDKILIAAAPLRVFIWEKETILGLTRDMEGNAKAALIHATILVDELEKGEKI